MVTDREYARLWDLSDRCHSMALVDGKGLTASFDDERWAAGVAEILGARTPPRDGMPTHLVVT
jgi:hypothetical protein